MWAYRIPGSLTFLLFFFFWGGEGFKDRLVWSCVLFSANILTSLNVYSFSDSQILFSSKLWFVAGKPDWNFFFPAAWEACPSRHNGCLVEGSQLNSSVPSCREPVMLEGYQEVLDRAPWCREAPTSRMFVSLIVVEIPHDCFRSMRMLPRFYLFLKANQVYEMIQFWNVQFLINLWGAIMRNSILPTSIKGEPPRKSENLRFSFFIV